LSDALCLATWARQQGYVDPARLGLLGISLGGLIAACTVARADAFKCLVLLNPTDVWNMRRLAGLYKDPPEDVFKYGINRLHARFCDDVATLDPLGDVMKFKGPMLLVQGGQDPAVELPVSDRYAYSRRRARLPVDQRVIDIGNHAFSSAEQQGLLYPIIADWLDGNLR
jgi:dipeptidyl aminopeptidase/acylaminoacyl peptidase